MIESGTAYQQLPSAKLCSISHILDLEKMKIEITKMKIELIRVPASVLVHVWSLVPHSCAHAHMVMVDPAYERGAHALSGKLEMSMSAYQETEILHLEIFATRQIRASVVATHEFPCLICRC